MIPLISVVCPTYNRLQYLPTAIRCFLQQTYPNKELIIVDDGTESSVIPADSRIRYIQRDVRMTTGMKRNLGAEAASGDIIASWDDDDWSHPHRLEDQVQRLLRTGKAVTGYCQTIRFYDATRTLYTGSSSPPYFVSGTSQMYMKSWWGLHPFPDASYGEDSVFSRTARLADQLAAANPGKMMVVLAHANNTDIVCPNQRNKLTPNDVSEEFFRAHDAPVKDLAYMTEPHICSDRCQADVAQQINSDIGQDYKVTYLPEIQTR